METEIIAQGGQLATVATDFSLISLFQRADWVVQSVIVLLLMASFWSWAIIIDKFFRLRRLRGQLNKFEDIFWSGKSLEDLYDKLGHRPDQPMALMFASAMREWRRSAESGPITAARAPNVKDRIAKVMNVTEARELDRVERFLSFLATVGSTAPFVGLFGTVWGIMNSFQAIATQNNTTLAVVAPGIAEALFATALGLLAAIPAVVAYNNFINARDRLEVRLDGFSEEFQAILSRQMDEGKK
jgi:biopolymer transport protein TolQ